MDVGGCFVLSLTCSFFFAIKNGEILSGRLKRKAESRAVFSLCMPIFSDLGFAKI